MDVRHAVGVKVGVPAEKLADVLTYHESPHFTEGERAVLQSCAHVTLVTIPGTGHASLIQKPERIAELVVAAASAVAT